MAKLSVSDFASIGNELTFLTTLNSNFGLVEAAIENTLSRDGTTPNEMEADLDMNSNRILNLVAAVSATEPVRLLEFQGLEDEFDVLSGQVADALAAMAAALVELNEGIDLFEAGMVLVNAAVAAAQLAETNAELAETNSETAQAAAEAAQAAAEAALANFMDLYLGPHAVEPTLDNEGNPLEAGDLYFDTVFDALRVWDGAAWIGTFALSLDDLTNVDIVGPTEGQALTYDDGTSSWINSTPVQTFLGLTDTPDDYTGDSLKLVRVNAGETALEFFTGAFTASAISFTPVGSIAATNVQDAIAELESEGAEFISDTVGAMVTGNTETLITVTYQDADNTLDFVVNNDLSAYDNTTSAFLTQASADALFLTPAEGNAAYQPLDADLTSWAGVTRAAGFDTFVATPSSANLATLVTGDTGTGALVFATSPGFTTAANPVSNDGAALGTTALGWSDLHLATGGVINWANGEMLVTGAANSLTVTGGLMAFDSSDGLVQIGDGTFAGKAATTDYGIQLGESGQLISGLTTEVDGTILSLGINTSQFGVATSADVGGIFRLDTRSTSKHFAILAKPTGGTGAGTNVFTVGLDSLTPSAWFAGNIELGHATDTTIARTAAGRVTIEAVPVNILTSQATAPSSPLAGDQWFDTDTGTLFYYVDSQWAELSGGGPSVGGPATSTDNAIARYDGTGGHLLQNSGVVIDDTGGLVVNHTTGLTTFNSTGNTPLSQVVGTNTNASRGTAVFSSAVSTAPHLWLARSRGTTIGSYTVVNDDDVLGYIAFEGSDGVDFARGANIFARVNGTPGSNDMPTELVFATSPDGAGVPTERMSISSAGVVTIGTGDLVINGTGAKILEIGPNDGVAAAAVIDFHSGATYIDFDSRILATGGTGSNQGGTLGLYAATIEVAAGIGFPGTPVSSTNANTLDEYEEGTWQPGMSFGGGTTGITYGSQSGTYTKIGKVVTYDIHLLLTSNGTSTGDANITGFPFSNGNSFPAGSAVIFQGAVTATGMTHYINGASTAAILKIPGATGHTTATHANIGDTFYYLSSGSYIAAT